MNYITESSGRRKLADTDMSVRAKDFPEDTQDGDYIMEREGILRNDAPRESYNPRRNSRDTLRNEEPMAERYLRKDYSPNADPLVAGHMQFDLKSGLGWSKTHFMVGIECGGSLRGDRS